MAVSTPMTEKEWSKAGDDLLLFALKLMEPSASGNSCMTWAGVAWYMTKQACNEGISNAKYTEQSVKQKGAGFAACFYLAMYTFECSLHSTLSGQHRP